MDNDLTIHQMVEECAKKIPDRIAIVDDCFSYSYSALNQKANMLAEHLRTFGLTQDTIIAISMDRSAQLLIGMLAILKSGCAYLPLDPEHPRDRLQYLLEDTLAPILITQSTLKEKFKDFRGHLILLDQLDTVIESPSVKLAEVNSAKDHSLAYIIYTSGSTGKPKGVLIEHKSVVNYIKWFYDYSACSEQNRIDFSSNVIFDMAITSTIAALALGLQIVICPDVIKKNVHEYLLHLNKNKINIIKLTPSYFKLLIQEAKNHPIDLFDLKTIILGGEILYTKECIAWLEMYPDHILFNEYGPTETTVAVTQYKISKENVFNLGTIVPIGKPGLNVNCSILKTGELYVNGTCLARGYLNQKELTSRQFLDGKSYKTGDLCRYLSDGNIEFIKRIDDQVKIRGYRIEPGEIEARLLSHPSIKEVSVIARENLAGENQLIGYYIPKHENQPPSTDELRQHLQQQLADYMIPAYFVMMKMFPLTENGKLDKKALPEPVLKKASTTPQNQLEWQLIDIWQKAFHIKEINRSSNFFELGGHSLIAARIIIEVEKHLRKKIRLEDLYVAPTIQTLAQIIAIAENATIEPTQKTISLNNSDSIPLSDFQFLFWISHFFEPKIKKLNIIARRRISGNLDKKALNFALKWVLEKHQVLSYQIKKSFPVQFIKNNIKFHITETDLTTCSELVSESKLFASLDEIYSNKKWQKNMPLIIAKLFHLKNDLSEIQICVPHMVFDDASVEVLFSDLSIGYQYYLSHSQLPLSKNDAQYKNYVLYERNLLNQQLEKDITFWKKYLHDTTLVMLPETEIIPKMGNTRYSTYIDLPLDVIENTHLICKQASVSITDLFCASIMLSIRKEAGHLNNNIFINIIRSVRDSEVFDKMIGCFLRLDPIKVDVKTNLNLIELAKVIQQSRIETESYQACSSMVKLACLSKNSHIKFIKNSIVSLFSTIYCKLFRRLKLNPKMLMMYGRLNLLRKKNQFLININLLNNFITPKHSETLFGLKLEKTKIHKYDLSKIDNILDICLLKNENRDEAYLVISGNLKASFRERLGNEIISLLGSKESYLDVAKKAKAGSSISL